MSGHAAGQFTGVCIDSRVAKAGDLFVAFKGEHQDGHQHVEDALRRGAYGAIVEHMPDGIDPEAHAQEVLEVPTNEPGIVANIDTPEQYTEWLARWKART